MKLCVAFFALICLALLNISCYNNPVVSDRRPADVQKQNYMSGPSVGPGTIAGGSTAGPQPAQKAEHSETEPAHNPVGEKH